LTTTTRTTTATTTQIASNLPQASLLPRLTYIAYPTSLTLQSANAIHTYSLTQAMRAQAPELALLVPRFARRPSRFTEVGATHLARLPFNAGRHLLDSIGWSYAERTWFAARVLAYLIRARLMRRAPAVLYVRDAVVAAWLALLARPLVGARVVYECHDLEAQNPSAQSGPITRRLASAIDRIVMRRSDGVVSLTHAFVAVLDAHPAARPSGPVAVIPDAYDDAVFFPRDKAAARAALALAVAVAPAAFTVVYVGSTWKYRGIDRLIEAFAAFADGCPDARLVLVGGRPDEQTAAMAVAREHGITAAVQCVGAQPQAIVAQYMAAADVLALSDTVSKASASPLKLFEYAACARPVALTDLPALREVLPDDGACWIPPGDTTAFADAFRWIASHPTEAAAMGARAAQAVAPHTYHARAAAVIAFCTRIVYGAAADADSENGENGAEGAR